MPTADPAAAHAPPGPGPLPALIGRPLALAYRAAITRINRRYDRGRAVTRLPVPVISVGNLSLGGTGKTPMVAHIVANLLKQSFPAPRPCIAMRGYAKRSRAGNVPGVASDEADAYRRLFPDLPIVAQRDRTAGLRALLAAPDPADRPTCIVLDDGFQHRRIARDLDIVLVDATRPPSSDRLFPAGWLREPAESLARADLVILTHAELVTPEDLARIERDLEHTRARPIDAVARHAWTGLVTNDHPLPMGWLSGKHLIACCAIGNPHGFLHALRSTVAAVQPAGQVVGAMILPDHDRFDPAVVGALVRLAAEKHAGAIIVTDKDWSKLRRLPADTWRGLPIIRPVLTLTFDRGQSTLDARTLQAAQQHISLA